MSGPGDRFRTAEFLAWEAGNQRHCWNAFGIGARDFALRWWAGGYGDIAQREASGNWRDELMLPLGQTLDVATGEDGAT